MGEEEAGEEEESGRWGKGGRGHRWRGGGGWGGDNGGYIILFQNVYNQLHGLLVDLFIKGKVSKSQIQTCFFRFDSVFNQH